MNHPKIIDIKEKIIVGCSVSNSVVHDKTGMLWQKFMPKRKQIENRLNSDYLSVEIYPKGLKFRDFDEETEFEKWAAVEVSKIESIPEGMKTLTIPDGKYAVFIHHGLAADFPKTLKYIFEDWMPNANFEEDSRPHFEVMGDKYYGPTDANSQEEVWVPIK